MGQLRLSLILCSQQSIVNLSGALENEPLRRVPKHLKISVRSSNPATRKGYLLSQPGSNSISSLRCLVWISEHITSITAGKMGRLDAFNNRHSEV